MNFWKNLKEKQQKGIMVLAPMADVTDPAFRRVIAKYGKPDVLWTEFVSADGLFLGGYEHLVKDLAFTEAERPIVAQFFTGKPEMMEKAAELAVDLGFDGIDINMGCPDKSIEKQGSGSGHIKDPKNAQEVIRAAMRGATKNGKNLPVSVKTRIGYNKNELETWLPMLLETNPAVITIHARTRKEMSAVPARWENVKRAVEIRNEFVDSKGKKSETLIFGNGDVTDLEDADKKVLETGCDGVMLGRAIFGNPWLFSRSTQSSFLKVLGKNPQTIQKSTQGSANIIERLRVMTEHTKLFEELLPHKSFAIMKKHYKAYVNGWDGAKELRMKLMDAKDADEVETIVGDYIKGL
ncbi:MAG: tRNA-dihydrouridine synthase family protein [Candidatus Zambryskibacteria bacterium]|nr:tRNA-dihydrouridine synthase family protein [Candidatus Zambryskibacteria bacterium]